MQVYNYITYVYDTQTIGCPRPPTQSVHAYKAPNRERATERYASPTSSSSSLLPTRNSRHRCCQCRRHSTTVVDVLCGGGGSVCRGPGIQLCIHNTLTDSAHAKPRIKFSANAHCTQLNLLLRVMRARRSRWCAHYAFSRVCCSMLDVYCWFTMWCCLSTVVRRWCAGLLRLSRKSTHIFL